MATNRVDADRGITVAYRNTILSWMGQTNEVFFVLRYLAQGGSKDFAFVETPEELEKLIDSCPMGTDIIAFKERQLTLRGSVTKQLLERIRQSFSEDCEYLWVRITGNPESDPRLYGCMGRSLNEMVDELESEIGERVAVGLCPNFHLADNESMISASKGGIDGPR